jgi:L-lactate utilization protein LutC
MPTKVPPSKCRSTNTQEYPMHPDCLELAAKKALIASKTVATEALADYAKESIIASNDLRDAQIKLAKALKKILDAKGVVW